MSTILFSQPIQIMELKSISDDWEITGYASTFGTKDLGQDIVVEGAFKKTLKSGAKTRFMRDHDPRLLLGLPLKQIEDKKGLFGTYRISKTKLGEETRQLVMDGALDSFSIGYEPLDYEIDSKENVRYLKEVKLYEVSLVSIPMNPEAIVTGIKDYLSLLGIQPEMTLVEKFHIYTDGLSNLLNDLRGLADKSRPLSETKRKELAELLETFSGLDAVRSNITVLLTANQPAGLVSSKLLAHQMAEMRKRLANILQE